jgi:hypothetical protein
VVQPRLILLHSPLLGPASWRAAAAALRRRGRAVETPAWPRLSAIGEGFYPASASAMAGAVDARPGRAILVAHSGAGALLPALATALRTPPAGAIFVDAILPHPGRSWFDTAPPELRAQLRAGAQDGLLPAWDRWWPPGALARLVPDAATLGELTEELEPLPVEYFEEPAPEAELAGPCAYLQLSGAYDLEARLAGRQGWPVVHLPLHHLAMLTNAEAVAAAIDDLAAKLGDEG